MSKCAINSSVLILWLTALHLFSVDSLITDNPIVQVYHVAPHVASHNAISTSRRSYSIVTYSKSTNEEEMTAQERILRDAGLWEKDDEKAVKESSSDNSATSTNSSYEVIAKEQKTRNVIVAIVASILALFNFFWQYSNPITDVQLLTSMQRSSAPVTCIGNNGKPTVVDFWAPWCENCKLAAPTLNKIEEEYEGKVNFVMINGDLGGAWPYIEAFRVDAIPHMALVSAEGDIKTALIGPVPKSVLEADLDVLIRNSNKVPESQEELPFVMLDVFKDAPNLRRVHFDK